MSEDYGGDERAWRLTEAERDLDDLLAASRVLARHCLGYGESREVAEAKETVERIEDKRQVA